MSTMTVEVTVLASAPGTEELIQVLRGLGVEPVREGRLIRCQSPAAACAVCGEVHSLAMMLDRPSLGGQTCHTCLSIGNRIHREFWAAATRGWEEQKSQLRQAIRDIRSGAEFPQFYRGIDG